MVLMIKKGLALAGLAVTFMTAPAVLAQDSMKQDSMKHDGMKHDGMQMSQEMKAKAVFTGNFHGKVHSTTGRATV